MERAIQFVVQPTELTIGIHQSATLYKDCGKRFRFFQYLGMHALNKGTSRDEIYLQG